MPQENYIRNLLNIKDKNIKFYKNVNFYLEFRFCKKTELSVNIVV